MASPPLRRTATTAAASSSSHSLSLLLLAVVVVLCALPSVASASASSCARGVGTPSSSSSVAFQPPSTTSATAKTKTKKAPPLLIILDAVRAPHDGSGLGTNDDDDDDDDERSSPPSSAAVPITVPSAFADDRHTTRRSALLRAAARSSASLLLLLSSASAVVVVRPLPVRAKSDPTSGTGAYDRTRREPDFVQKYEDFTSTDEGWSYKDVKVGGADGDVEVEEGDRVVFDWSGYTIGYFGRPFEAKGGPRGGAFDRDVDYSRTIIGSHAIVPGVECALRTMKPGGIRQVVVPYGDLSYPPDDLEHVRVGPKPTTFSGRRALNFVLENPRVDRTLLFNVKLIRVDKKDGRGGFVRGW